MNTNSKGATIMSMIRVGSIERRCAETRRTDQGVARRCDLDAGHEDAHEAWGTGPHVLSGLIWPNTKGAS